MNKKKILLLLTAVILLQLLLGLLVLKHTEPDRLDTVLVNDMAKTAGRKWESLKNGEPFTVPAEWNILDFAVVSEEGDVLLSVGSGVPLSVAEAVENRDTIVDIRDGMQTKGKLLIRSPYRIQAEQKGRFIFYILLGGIAAEAVLVILSVCLLEHTVIRPFEKLRVFAAHVAEGNLDLPLEMDRNNIFGVFTESFDLMREELKEARTREWEANQSKKELVAELSHDIKTPVASIRAVSELMLVSAQEEKDISRLTVIREKTEQIDRLVSDLFHATLEELKELTVTVSDQSSLLLQEMLQAADYLKVSEMNPVPECMLVFDRMRLQQVFDNIFSNSYKYADTPVRVSFAYEEEYLCVRMEDEGPGVAEEECPLLFQKYYRGNNAKGRSGAGLGLFISRYLLGQMQGKITCSNMDTGFQVTVYLKLA